MDETHEARTMAIEDQENMWKTIRGDGRKTRARALQEIFSTQKKQIKALLPHTFALFEPPTFMVNVLATPRAVLRAHDDGEQCCDSSSSSLEEEEEEEEETSTV